MTAEAEPAPTPPAPATPTTPSAGAASTAQARRRTRALAVAAAVAASVLIWLVTVPMLGHDLVARDWTQRPMEITLVMVITFALLSSLAGWGLLALLERFTRPAPRIWTIIAVAVWLLSFSAVTDPEMTTGTRISLGLMHFAVGAALILPLSRSSRNSR